MLKRELLLTHARAPQGGGGDDASYAGRPPERCGRREMAELGALVHLRKVVFGCSQPDSEPWISEGVCGWL